MTNFSKADLEQIRNKGISLNTIEYQINSFKKGFPFAKLIAPAIPAKGVIQLNSTEVSSQINYYNTYAAKYDIVKFVPASGAASRMFKLLFEFKGDLENKDFELLIKENKYADVKTFFERLTDFAFYEDLEPLLKSHKADSKTDFAKECLSLLLDKEGLNYAQLPKALLKFHKYNDNNRFAIEEHLMEAEQYAKTKNGIARLHFTVSPEHFSIFKDKLDSLSQKYEAKFQVKYDISLSTQKSSTDTIAVDLENNPFRDIDGELVFRPGGHGALIENLNDLDADLIFVKNIDNIVTDEKRKPTVDYKKALAAMAMSLQKQIFYYLQNIENQELDSCLKFIKTELGLSISPEFESYSNPQKIDFLKQLLNRPLRVCGVVPNVGEPGGGPFWVNKNETNTLQIVESAEVNTKDPLQNNIMQEATHFNPVDLICMTKDYLGNKFDLKLFVDNNSAFISEKSKDGKSLKAMELPGLWNGAMAFWNTIFVEVPIETFNPVKTVNDLLRPMHL